MSTLKLLVIIDVGAQGQPCFIFTGVASGFKKKKH